MASGGRVCRFYGSAQGCYNGDSCRFIHDTTGTLAGNTKSGMPRCRFYRTPSGCRLGSMCRFRHDDEATCQRLRLQEESLYSDFSQLSLDKPAKGDVDGETADHHDEEEEEEEDPSTSFYHGLVKYTGTTSGPGKLRPGAISLHHCDNGDWRLEMFLDCLPDCDSILTLTLTKATILKVVCRQTGFILDHKLDGDYNCVTYRPDDKRDIETLKGIMDEIMNTGTDEDKAEGDDDDQEEEAEEEEVEDEEDCSYGDYDSDEERLKRWEEWKKERDGKSQPDIHKAKCGECSSIFKGKDAFDQLKAHYHEMLMTKDFKHMKFLSQDARFKDPTMCIICEKFFGKVKSLMCHTIDKSKRTDKDGEEHQLFLDKGIVEPLCYRDTVDHDDAKLHDELVLALVNTFPGLDDSDDDFMGLPGYMLGRGLGGYDFDNDSDDDGGMYGFSNDDCYELLCQGIKPWDPEAGAAMAVLNGY